MIEATCELLKNSYENNNSLKARYVLLSGADYPIRPNAFINEVLEQDLEFIDIAPTSFANADKPMRRFEYYHFDYNKSIEVSDMCC